MPKILEKLQSDHRQHDLLLTILEKQIKEAHLYDEPDYEVVSQIVDYFLTYPVEFHHAREDRIFAKLQERDPSAAAEIGHIEEEHQACDAYIRAFAAALSSVLGTGILTRSQFTNAAMEFIDCQRRHIRMEEIMFFPTALRVLTKSDWDALDADLDPKGDPIFGAQHEEHFLALRQEIVDWLAGGKAANDHLPTGREKAL